MTFAGTFLTTISDTLDFTGLIGQKLGDLLDDIDMDNRRSYCCSKNEIKNWKDCYWAVGSLSSWASILGRNASV